MRLTFGQRIGVQRQEDICPGSMGHRDACLKRNEDVIITCHHHAKTAVADQQ